MVSSNASNINISVHTRNHFSLDVELPSRWCFRNLGDIPCPRKMWLGQLKYVGIMMFPSIWAKNVPNYQPRIHGWIRYVLAKLMEITKHPVICIFLRFLLDTNNIQITTIVAPRVWVKSWPLLLEGHVFLIPNKCPIMNLDLDGWALIFSPFFFLQATLPALWHWPTPPYIQMGSWAAWPVKHPLWMGSGSACTRIKYTYIYIVIYIHIYI